MRLFVSASLQRVRRRSCVRADVWHPWCARMHAYPDAHPLSHARPRTSKRPQCSTRWVSSRCGRSVTAISISCTGCSRLRCCASVLADCCARCQSTCLRHAVTSAAASAALLLLVYDCHASDCHSDCHNNCHCDCHSIGGCRHSWHSNSCCSDYKSDLSQRLS